METVQLQCGNCNRIMAISTEHLGGQVQCPHCRSVVQTPPRTPAAPPPPAPAAPQRESIFSGPEPSEDLFGGPAQPKVEMPPEPKPAGLMPAPSALETPAESDADLTKFKRRPLYDASMVPFIAMIFLVPYSILTTLFIIYLLLYGGGASRGDQFEYLRDPASSPKKGGPQRVSMQPKHDLPLPAHLRTTLNKPIKIGDLTVTAEKVRLNSGGDLEIFLRAKNNSPKWGFQPISDVYLLFTTDKAGNEPYTFLETKSKNISNIYGGTQQYRKSFKDKADLTDSLVGPGGEAHIVLTTYDKYRTQVANVVKSKDDEFLWRVHVRRGFVKVDNKDVSATAVIGVEFSAAEIEKAS